MSLYKSLLKLLNKTLKIDADFAGFLKAHFQLSQANGEDTVRLYSSEDLQLQLIRDHNNLQFINISSITNPGDWFDMDIVRSYIVAKTTYLDPLPFCENTKFIIENYNTIRNIFNEKCSLAIQEMVGIQKKRAGKLFGTEE